MSTYEIGLVKFSLSVLNHVRNILMPQFDPMDSDRALPIFIKYWDQWFVVRNYSNHCRRANEVFPKTTEAEIDTHAFQV